MKLTGENRSTREKSCPSATSSTTNPIWTDPGSNSGLRGERPATNRLSHGTALHWLVLAFSLSRISRNHHICIALYVDFKRIAYCITNFQTIAKCVQKL
jgi:hypothetical protein